MRIAFLRSILIVVVFSCAPKLSLYAATVSGDLVKWHPITVDFKGPLAQETDDSNNPFLDYRLTVDFTSPSGRTYRVPGFFAGDGAGGSRGDIWRARFSADESGSWTYSASLRQGSEVAISLDDSAGSAANLEGQQGQFDVSGRRSDAAGFLRYGRLEYVGQHYMKFRDGPYWIKGGTDSPENLLGFAGIDGTVDQGGIKSDFLHDFAQHRGDWNTNDPLFTNSTTGVDSRGLIGAFNYLGEQGVNSVYFLPMNLGGDGQETFPFVGASNNRYDKTHYDISKLYQWNLVLNHAQEQGVALNIVLSETESENERWLDNRELGVERKLFFRELIARFGYLLAVKWNLGEENDFPRVELDKHADYIQALDWSDKPIAVHTHINQFFRYGEIIGDSRYSASSIQYEPQFAGQFVEQWRANSTNAGRPWVIDMDENTSGLVPGNVDQNRKQVMYDVFFSGGNIEWFFGSPPLPIGGDVDAGDFRVRETMWQQMRFARQMMENELPFWQMEPADSLVEGDSSSYGGAEVFALSGEVYAIYLPATNGSETLDLSNASGSFRLRWFDPRNGQMFNSSSELSGSGKRALGSPPSSTGEDWVALVTRGDGSGGGSVPEEPSIPDNNSAPRFVSLPSPTVSIGEQFSVTLTATDPDGTFPSVTVGQVPGGMQVEGPGNGQLLLNWTVPASAASTSIVELIARDAADSSIVTNQILEISVRSANDGDGGEDSAPDDNQNNEPDDNQSNEPDAPVEDNQGGSEIPDSAPRFINLPTPTVSVGDTLNLTLQAVDDSGVAPVVTVGNLPGGMRISGPGDGALILSWLVPDQADALSVVELIAIDTLDRSVRTQQNLLINVVDGNDANPADQGDPGEPSDSADNVDNSGDSGSEQEADSPVGAAPVFEEVGSQNVKVGEQLLVRILARDEDGIPPGIVVLNRPEAATFNDNGDGTRTFAWVPGDEDVGERLLTFVARDHSIPTLTDTMEVNVQVNR